ncbi:hypothetical protein [Sphingomonas sp. Ant H11]|uniref:hypothetical protein n=1 Tax=Sphingomonas sp. Ant H11 TaxID=1564113 RepID=UPI00053DC6AD|nr:hypothetical protein [Sphingomonas sp. Ant H11]
MRVFVYVLLAVATLCGYIFPIVLGVFVAPSVGETSLTFPQIGVLWVIAFGVCWRGLALSRRYSVPTARAG